MQQPEELIETEEPVQKKRPKNWRELSKEETVKLYDAGKKAAERHAKLKPFPYTKGGR